MKKVALGVFATVFIFLASCEKKTEVLTWDAHCFASWETDTLVNNEFQNLILVFADTPLLLVNDTAYPIKKMECSMAPNPGFPHGDHEINGVLGLIVWSGNKEIHLDGIRVLEDIDVNDRGYNKLYAKIQAFNKKAKG